MGIPNLPHYSDIEHNSDGCIFNIRNSGQTLTNKNCKKTRASNNIDMKLAPVTKLDKKTTTTLKRIDDGASPN